MITLKYLDSTTVKKNMVRYMYVFIDFRIDNHIYQNDVARTYIAKPGKQL